MSRIYQGGQSQGSYQASNRKQNYNPVQALSQQQAIIQEGESKLRDMKTKERQAQRKDSMSDLERKAKDASDVSTLEMEQRRATNILRQKELVEKAELQTAELAAKAKLSMSQTTEKGQVSIEQTSDKNVQKLNQFRESANLKLAQMLDTSSLKQSQQLSNDNLKRSQTLDSNTLKQSQTLDSGLLKLAQSAQSSAQRHTQQGERLGLDYVNKSDLASLQLQHKEENYLLSSEQSAQKADMQLASTHLSLSHQVERSNTQLLSSTISSLLSFAGTVATEIQKNNAEAEQEEIGRAEFDALLQEPIVSSSGVVHPSITGEAGVQNIEVAEEQAIRQVNPGDTITQEALRQPGADQSQQRAESQAYVAGSALNLTQRLSDLVDSDPTVLNGQGQPVSLNSLRTSTEYASGVKQLVRGLYDADGISRGDSYAAYTTYGRAARAAYNAQVQQGSTSLRARVKYERYDSGLSAGTALHASGQAQAGWNMSSTQAFGSGHFDNKTPRQTNTQTLKDYMSRIPREKVLDMLDVKKVPGQAGTEFRNDPEYNKIIRDEYNSRIADENKYFTTQEKSNTNEVKQITQDVNMALMADGLDGVQSKAIREEARARLYEINTPQAMEYRETLREKGGNNQSVYLGFVEGFEGGYPPSSAELAAARADDSITHEQLEGLKTMGLRSDQIVQAMEKAGLPSIDKQLKNAISMRLGAADVEPTERAGLSDRISAYLLPAAKTQFNNFLNQEPPPSSLQIQQEATRIIDGLGEQVWDPKNPDGGLLNSDAGSGIASLNIDQQYATTRRNPTTGLFQKVWKGVEADQLPRTPEGKINGSVNDAYLNKSTFLESVELWDKGRPGSEYPKRVQEIAKGLGVSPTSFIRSQAQALGYPSIEKVSPAIMANPPTDMKTGFNALQSMGFPTRGAAYLSGNIMQESSWNGQQKPWGEVANDGSDRNGGLVSWMDGVAHNNFRLTKIEDYLGKGIAQASPSEQLQAMQWEMKKDYPNAYRTFMNPNATDVQLRRASREYWGYGHEGDRYSNAQSLLR